MERLNSSAGYIYNKLRTSLAPDTLEKLTLARAHLLAKAKELAKGKNVEELDLEDLLAEEKAAMEAAESEAEEKAEAREVEAEEADVAVESGGEGGGA